mgnify:CR=1 FL=1
MITTTTRTRNANAIITMGAAPGPDDWFSELPSFYTNKPTILGVPVGQVADLVPSPPRPCWFNSIVFHASVTVLPLLPRTRTLDGVGGLTGLRPLPPTPNRQAQRTTIERSLRRFST